MIDGKVLSFMGGFGMDKRLFPVSVEFFNINIKPSIKRAILKLVAQPLSAIITFSAPCFMCFVRAFRGAICQTATAIGIAFISASNAVQTAASGGEYCLNYKVTKR